MSLAHGRSYLAIPGPSVIPDRVLNAMHRAAPNIYAGALHDMTASLMPDLRAVARTRGHVAVYIANGHGAWEAANANMFSRGDRAVVLSTGRFGIGWADSAQRMGVAVETIDFGKSVPLDTVRLAEVLAADRGHAIRAVLVSHVDTASAVRNDLVAVRAAIDAAGHPALLAADCIAAMGCERFEMDAWGVDVAVGASQKGLMTPPGLGFVWFNDRAADASRAADLRTPYWDWGPRVAAEEYSQIFCGTAPTHHLFALREALNILLHEEGLETAWARHAALARAVWAAFDAWGAGHPDIGLNIAPEGNRSHAVTAARLGAPHATALREWCEARAGVTLGIGLGMAVPGDPAFHGYLRIGHMGHVNAHMVMGVLGVMESGMQALSIPHGRGGVQAAADALATAAAAGRG